MKSTGIISFGVKCPIIREGDNLKEIVLSSVRDSQLGMHTEDGDIIGITESVVARSQGNYVTVDDIVRFMEEEKYEKKLLLYRPIMSRNRFSLILRAFSRYANEIVVILGTSGIMNRPVKRYTGEMSGYNSVFGLLGSNIAGTHRLKLFPDPQRAQELVHGIREAAGKDIHVLVYGDGCFRSPRKRGYSIWKFADPVSCPAYTEELSDLHPNEIKLKSFADGKYADLSGVDLEEAVKKEIREKNKNLESQASSLGTTPRNLLDILASTFDLISGEWRSRLPSCIYEESF